MRIREFGLRFSFSNNTVRTTPVILDEAEEQSTGVEGMIVEDILMEKELEAFDSDEDEIGFARKHLTADSNDEGLGKGKVSNNVGVINELKIFAIDEPNMEETLLRKEYMNALEHERMLEDLAKENLSIGSKLFVYP